MNLGPGWNNMGKQDFSCQRWLEQGGGREREREGTVCPGLSAPLPFSSPFQPPPPPRGTGVTRGYNPLWWREAEGEGGRRGREECRVGESEWTAWPTHFSC